MQRSVKMIAEIQWRMVYLGLTYQIGTSTMFPMYTYGTVPPQVMLQYTAIMPQNQIQVLPNQPTHAAQFMQTQNQQPIHVMQPHITYRTDANDGTFRLDEIERIQEATAQANSTL
eukprot:991272_1